MPTNKTQNTILIVLAVIGALAIMGFVGMGLMMGGMMGGYTLIGFLMIAVLIVVAVVFFTRRKPQP